MVDMPMTSTPIEVSGTLKSGEKIAQVLSIPHQQGHQPALVLMGALNFVRQYGGLIIDGTEGGVDFYPLEQFDGPLQFRARSILLASPSQIPRIH